MATTHPESKASDLLTSQQVADRLAVSVRTLWRLVSRGRFPQPVRYNRKLVRWKSAEVDRYIEALRDGPYRTGHGSFSLPGFSGRVQRPPTRAVFPHQGRLPPLGLAGANPWCLCGADERGHERRDERPQVLQAHWMTLRLLLMPISL